MSRSHVVGELGCPRGYIGGQYELANDTGDGRVPADVMRTLLQDAGQMAPIAHEQRTTNIPFKV